MRILLNVNPLLKIHQWQPMSYRIEKLIPGYGIQAPSFSSPCNAFACHANTVFSCRMLCSLPRSGLSDTTPLSLTMGSLCIPENLLLSCYTASCRTSDAPLHMFPLASFLCLYSSIHNPISLLVFKSCRGPTMSPNHPYLGCQHTEECWRSIQRTHASVRSPGASRENLTSKKMT